ncbi:non-specific lipid-transfer protein-like protein [Heracleum sosnowskyi]|uniref:Non-specific lipid-transfer protein-like protein n=1 Tax=Heracleum sosnowskyi TaxID=360622 RepID=A0AAD8N595_9APIA|nr:non-specific lipid-transfer protein-like protein [Heracleum sosnowskyi]
MAYQNTSFALAMVLMAILWTGSTAQTSDCTNTLISLSPCLNYITGNSSKPDSGCCTQLSSVARSKPECLCQAINGGGSSFGIQVNQTQARTLPAICNVQTPPLSTCNSISPNGAPAGSPNAPSGPGSNTTPSTDSGSSDGSSTKVAAPFLFFLVFVASYASTFVI